MIQDQVAELNPDQKMIFLHGIIHQEVLCKCVLKMNHVVDTVTKVVNFIKAKSLNHRQFVSAWEQGVQFSVPAGFWSLGPSVLHQH